eukprot:gnl/TRDRNA2_/TRDRNA2_126960_c2_seq1.p2 gnl/TRDRNA2_/TRDRNA2_126960_c2~~gnl/TRDRNA2_/TRDRNA2_126960_c2_seq1.p2  ORF type:complete len:124 (+),score=11.13 gnl/TRDRNA2_/TRDRNA2_126960_c2_seq1:442-813(+)
MQHYVQESGAEVRAFHAKAGDIGIWHKRLVHGASFAYVQNRTRRSLVIHFARRWRSVPQIRIEMQRVMQDRGTTIWQVMRDCGIENDRIISADTWVAMLQRLGMKAPGHLLQALLVWSQTLYQ